MLHSHNRSVIDELIIDLWLKCSPNALAGRTTAAAPAGTAAESEEEEEGAYREDGEL